MWNASSLKIFQVFVYFFVFYFFRHKARFSVLSHICVHTFQALHIKIKLLHYNSTVHKKKNSGLKRRAGLNRESVSSTCGKVSGLTLSRLNWNRFRWCQTNLKISGKVYLNLNINYFLLILFLELFISYYE